MKKDLIKNENEKIKSEEKSDTKEKNKPKCCCYKR